MRPSWIPILVAAIACGCAAASLAPRPWGFTTPYGLLVGTALYFVSFQSYVVRVRPGLLQRRLRWLGPDGVLIPSLQRAALFLGLVALLLYAVYDLFRDTDLNWPLVTLAAWSLVEPGWPRRAVGPAAGDGRSSAS